MPSPPPVGVQIVSLQGFGAVAFPGAVQAPPGHSLGALHGVKAFAPPRQRRPPQAAPPQSAFDWHGSAFAVGQVSQKHLFDVKPTARQLGLALLKVSVFPALELESGTEGTASSPMRVPVKGGQSKLVVPKIGSAETELPSQARLLC
jgi:hypothetical protein